MAHNVLYEGPGTCVWKDAGHEIESGRLLKENIEMSQKRLEGEGKKGFLELSEKTLVFLFAPASFSFCVFPPLKKTITRKHAFLGE